MERALAGALAEERLTNGQVEALLARHARCRSTSLLARLLNADDCALTRSEAEERLLALVTRAQRPSPHVNARVAGREVDFLWRRDRLIVEVDGFEFHGDRDAFENDRRRDAILVAAGHRVVRVTWRHLTGEPEAVLARLVRALTLAAPTDLGSSAP